MSGALPETNQVEESIVQETQTKAIETTEYGVQVKMSQEKEYVVETMPLQDIQQVIEELPVVPEQLIRSGSFGDKSEDMPL